MTLFPPDDAVAAADPSFRFEIDRLAEGPGALDLMDGILKTPQGALHSPIEITADEDKRRHTSKHARITKAILAAAAVLMLTAAAWGAIAARTGMFGEAGSEEGEGELIRLDASGAESIIDEIGAGISLPPGRSFDGWKSQNLKRMPDGAGVMMTETAIESTLSSVAACLWTEYWLDGYNRRDERVMARAQGKLDEIPRWDALVVSDADGALVSSLENRARGARLKQPSLFLGEYRINCTEVHPQYAP